MSGRRGLLLSVAGCALGGAAALGAASLTWASVVIARPNPLPDVHRDLAGGDIEPLLTALGLVLLAGVVGVAATRRFGRIVVGVLVALAGAGIVAVAVGHVGGTPPDRLAVLVESAVAAAPDQVSADESAQYPLLAAAGGLLGAVAGAAIAVRGRRWPGLGSTYDAPASAAEAGAEGGPPVSQREFWDALDRGDDPTDVADRSTSAPPADDPDDSDSDPDDSDSDPADSAAAADPATAQVEAPPPGGPAAAAGYHESAELPPRGRGRRERSR